MQKTFFTFFIISIFFLSNCFAQSNSCKKGHCLKGDRGYISFAIGPGIPLGNFADNNLNNTNSGFANTGSKMELNAGYVISKSLDFSALLFYSSNSYDAVAFTNQLSSLYPGTRWTSSGRAWDIYGGLIGINYSYPLTKKFTGDFKFLTGVMNSSTPQMIATETNGTKITESSKSASSLAYMLSAGGHYPLGRLIDVVGSLEFLSSSPTFDNISRYSSTPGYLTGTMASTSNQSINLLSLNFGFRVKF
jgi:hypothetical protein